jgi:hypothetical protein
MFDIATKVIFSTSLAVPVDYYRDSSLLGTFRAVPQMFPVDTDYGREFTQYLSFMNSDVNVTLNSDYVIRDGIEYDLVEVEDMDECTTMIKLRQR